MSTLNSVKYMDKIKFISELSALLTIYEDKADQIKDKHSLEYKEVSNTVRILKNIYKGYNELLRENSLLINERLEFDGEQYVKALTVS